MKHSLYINSTGKVVRAAKIGMGASFQPTQGMVVALGTPSINGVGGAVGYYIYRGDQWYSTLQP